MKNFLLTAIIFFSVTAKAQITLEYTNDTLAFGEQFYCVDIGSNEYKFIHVNPVINGFSLYNLDMSPFISNVVVPTADSIAKGLIITYVSRTLFDCDSSNIEYAYEAPYGSTRYPFRIFRTDGSLIFKVDSARGPYCFGCFGGATDVRPIKNTPEGTKLFLDKLNPSGKGILIYSLCGSLPTGYKALNEPQNFIKVFPNPTTGSINFEFIAPSNSEHLKLSIIDLNGNLLKTESISGLQHHYSLDVKSYSSGTYIFSLSSENTVYQSGKFILNK
jgi:hypothetical protein